MFIGTQFSILYTSMYSPAGAVIAVVVLIAWVGRYEGAYDNGKRHGSGTHTCASGDRCVRHGRGVPGVSRGGAHAQRAGAWRAGSMQQDMTDALVCRGGGDGRGCGMRAVGGHRADVGVGMGR